MKLASLKTKSSRDGELIVCSRDLSRATSAAAIAPTMQNALDRWTEVEGPLRKLADQLDAGRAKAFELDVTKLAAPLPRPLAWIDSSVYLNHMELARKLRNAELPEVYYHEPLLSPRVSATFLGPRDAMPLPPGDMGLDLEGEIAMILGDVPYRATLDQARQGIRLVTLVNDISLRTIFTRDAARGKTTYHGKTIPAMAPVAATLDELGDAWDGGRIDLALECEINGVLLGQPNAATDMNFDMPTIVQQGALYRGLEAGTVIASGTVSNRDRSVGSCCIVERRMLDKMEHGEPKTPYLKPGDEIRIEMHDRAGRSVFGAIRQVVKAAA